jgi:hypothetical protein
LRSLETRVFLFLPLGLLTATPEFLTTAASTRIFQQENRARLTQLGLFIFALVMASTSTSGLTRRRGGGGGGAANGDGENGGSSVGRTNSSTNVKDSAPETSYESGENGHKIAFDPRDISESAERSKQPKLTLMEEVLLLGLKDKQVCPMILRVEHRAWDSMADNSWVIGLPVLLERQHLLCSPRMHRPRACLPRPHQHAERCLTPTIPPTRPYH